MSSYPALARLMNEPICEICNKKISNYREQVCMNPSETIYAHQDCIQVNCLYCTRTIPKILLQISQLKARVVVTGPAIQFAHIRCYEYNTSKGRYFIAK